MKLRAIKLLSLYSESLHSNKLRFQNVLAFNQIHKVTNMKKFNTLSLVALFISVSAGAKQLPENDINSDTLLSPLLLNSSGVHNYDDDFTYYQCYLNPVSCF